MITSLCSRKRVGRLRLVQRFMALTGILLVTLSGAGYGQSKEFYETDNYNPLQESKSGKLGTLFNAQPHLLLSVPTTLHGPQDVWTTAYLPFVDQEFDPSIPLTLFGPNYTTGIALASPRDPALELYAPIQVRCIKLSGSDPGMTEVSALAKSFPLEQSPLTTQGPFNELLHLNSKEPSFASQQISHHALSTLVYAQQFARFSHEVLTDQDGVGWNGSDKKGKVPIRFSIVEGEIPGFEVAKFAQREQGKGEILIPSSEYNIGVKHYTIAHEIGHAITFNVNGPEAFTNYSRDLKEICEGFSDILGHSFRLWMRPEKFTVLDWELFREYVFPSEKSYPFDDPKLAGNPNAYLGQYYQTDPLAPDYDVHTNAGVLVKWFSLVVEGGQGFVDDKVDKGAYWVKPLVPGDVSASYTLALRILFQAFTNPMLVNTNYPLLRSYIVKASQDLGHVPGSYVHDQISRAWAAVGVGELNYVTTCDQTYAESLLNGTVEFPATTFIGEDPTQFARVLSDCSQSDVISILNNKGTPMTDWDGDKNYSETNDEYQSKVAISIYNFGRLSRDFFRKNFDHGGYDVTYKMTDLDDGSLTVEFFENEAVCSLTYGNKEAVGDRIAKNYFAIVNSFAKEPLFPNQQQSWEHKVFYNGIANIYALEIKREFELSKGNSDAHTLWTVAEDDSNLGSIGDFSDPKKYGQPALYKGQFWDDGKPRTNAGIINFFYYLLAHGTKNDLGQDDGYTNVELPDKIYFVNAIDRRLVWKVLWNAYLSVSYQAGIEEFRQATFVALQQLDPVKYHSKSKEYIAFYDAWAAVLGLPDYASNLKHFPSDGNPVYPWAVTVGMEVEYPLYESYRLFEVSKSSTFKESDAPVHRFVSKQSPDVATGMTYSDINLEGGQVYWVRTRLAEGEDSRQFCATTDDPHFCESLLNKKKWSIPFAITTESIPAPQAISPGKGEQVRAWGNTFSVGQVPGARGYALHITDPVLSPATHTVSFDKIYDDENPDAVIKHPVALSAEKAYSYKAAARQKLGSEWAVHVLPGGLIKTMSAEEKEQFKDIYSDATAEIAFKTDLPAMKLQSPEDGAKVALFGSPIDLQGKESGIKRADYFQLELESPLLSEKLASPQKSILGSELGEFQDGKMYQWRMTPFKKATAPFIPEDEAGRVPDWFHFTMDKTLVPKPILGDFACFDVGAPVQISWEPVAGAEGYEYSVINLANQQQVANGIVENGLNSPILANASQFPGPYLRKVRAGVRDQNGNWVWGPEGEKKYGIVRPDPVGLSPDNVSDVKLGNNNSVLLSWQLPAGVTTVDLFARVDAGEELIKTTVTGSSFLLEGVPNDKTILWSVMSKSPDNSCNNNLQPASFHTEAEPINFDPVLNFKFVMGVTDVLGWGIQDPFIMYNLTVKDPNGSTVLNKASLNSSLSQIDEKLPAVSGLYIVTTIVTKADPVYLKTEEEEGGVVSLVQLFNKAGNQTKLLDTEALGVHFDPVQNLIIQLQFSVDLANSEINLRGNAANADTLASELIKVRSIELKYPELDMTIFPNPAGNQVQIMPGLAVKEKQCTLEVIDQQGRTVISRSWQGEKLDISTLAEGMYVVRVKSGALTSSQKLFVKK